MSNSKVSEGVSVNKYKNKSDKSYGETQIIRSVKDKYKTYGYNGTTIADALIDAAKEEASIEMHLKNLDKDDKAYKQNEIKLEDAKKKIADLKHGINSAMGIE